MSRAEAHGKRGRSLIVLPFSGIALRFSKIYASEFKMQLIATIVALASLRKSDGEPI